MALHRPLDNGPSLELQIQYRTLSINVEEQSSDRADAIRQIDVHTLPVDTVYQRYSTSPIIGLETPAVARLTHIFGKNVISPPKTQYWKKVLNYIFGGFNFLMWIASILTLLSYKPLGEPSPQAFYLGVAVLLFLVISLSATFYAVVDFHASRIMKSVRNLIAEEATVIRNGLPQIIPSVDIVVGDIVLLSAGDRVPADIRIVEASMDLRFDRSLLTGESHMTPGTVDSTSENPMETRNLALNSTIVVQGKCTGVVFATGDKTIMGRIVIMSGDTKFTLTTAQKEVWFFTKIISALALGFFCISMIVWAAFIRIHFPGYLSAKAAIINSIGCLTAFVPQGVPVCVALSLTIVARRMAARKVLVKNLANIETLGCMSVLCSDKTGTLTEGNMSVQRIAVAESEYSLEGQDETCEKYYLPELSISLSSSSPLSQLSLISRLCNGARFGGNTNAPVRERTVKGDPTDSAVLRFAEESLHKCLSLDDTADVLSLLSDEYRKIFEIPFNSRDKWMMSIVQDYTTRSESPGTWMLIKGAPDILFPYSTSIIDSNGKSVLFNSAHQNRLTQLQHKWSSEGQRVIAVCKRALDPLKLPRDETELEELLYNELDDLTLVGLISLRDPLRTDVRDAVRIIRAAGIRIFMITGDFMITAVGIAKQAGIISQDRYDTIHSLSSYRRDSGSEPSRRNLIKGANIPVLMRQPSEMKPGDDDPIRAIVLTGDDVEQLTEDTWDTILSEYTEIVFSRTTPQQKMRIVEETKKRGDNIVAVTGDGVNDAPAMKASDIAIAMGSGTEVAKEAASIILLNNDFSSIPAAIELGRLVFDNLKKVILYLMPAGTYTEFIAVFANVFLGMQLSLSTYLQVCFSITNDVVMSIALMYEQPESDLMARKPRNVRTERLTDWRFFFQIYLFIGLMMWPCAMALWFLYMSEQGLGFFDVILVYNQWQDGFRGFTIEQLTNFVSTGQCVYYISIVFMQYGGLLAVRNRRVSILNSNPLWGPRRNLAVPAGMLATALIGVANLYGPGLQRVFLTTPIPAKFWGIPFAFALGILIMDETRKLIVRTYPKSIIAKMAW